MRKTRIKVRANIAAYDHDQEPAQLVVDDWRDMTTEIVESDGEAEIHLKNVELAEFGIQTKRSLANSICKT